MAFGVEAKRFEIEVVMTAKHLLTVQAPDSSTAVQHAMQEVTGGEPRDPEEITFKATALRGVR